MLIRFKANHYSRKMRLVLAEIEEKAEGQGNKI